MADIQETTVNKIAFGGFAIASILGTSLVLAQVPADEHAGHHPPGVAQPSTPPAARSPTPAAAPAATPRLQDDMKNMQELMAKIHASKDSAERQKLMQQHSKAMLDQMRMMRGMGGQRGMMDHQAMQAQMNMMQLMMDQMLQHQDAQSTE